MSIYNLPELHALTSWTTRKTQLRCVNVVDETNDVKTFQFVAVPAHLFHFKPGQFIGIQLEIDGERHNRSYTIASTPTRPHLLELTIKLDPVGKVSPWLHKNMVKGATLEVRGPAGRFNLMDIAANPASDKLLMISAGSGITPLMSMARFLCDQASDQSIQFLNWVRSTQDIIFRRELSLMDHQHAQFELEVICTQPGLTENWLGRRGRVNQTLLTDLVPDLHQRTIFCCGPDGFMQNVKQCLIDLGFDMSHYHDETFDPGGKKKAQIAKQAIAKPIKPAEKEQPLGPFKLSLQQSAKTLELESSDYVLEAIENAGVQIDSSCRAGNCGTCQLKKISGDTYTENETGLAQANKAEGYILTCCTQLRSDVVLDI